MARWRKTDFKLGRFEMLAGGGSERLGKTKRTMVNQITGSFLVWNASAKISPITSHPRKSDTDDDGNRGQLHPL